MVCLRRRRRFDLVWFVATAQQCDSATVRQWVRRRSKSEINVGVAVGLGVGVVGRLGAGSWELAGRRGRTTPLGGWGSWELSVDWLVG